jgi:hypothetical protein
MNLTGRKNGIRSYPPRTPCKGYAFYTIKQRRKLSGADIFTDLHRRGFPGSKGLCSGSKSSIFIKIHPQS